MTISELIQKIQRAKKFTEFDVRYVHPTLYLICIDPAFEGKNDDVRRSYFLQSISLDEETLANFRANPIIELLLLSPKEREEEYSFLEIEHGGQHWISAFNPLETKKTSKAKNLSASDTPIPRAIHFYGYKGGQGRSTVLLALAKSLADAGYRVLLVDADIEAPSLDSMLGVAADNPRETLMGLSTYAPMISPISKAYVGALNRGYIDLLPSRPLSSAYDIDFAAFLLNASLDAKLLEKGIKKLQKFVAPLNETGESTKYDVVLFDHRTGLAPSILPIMDAWPGSAVIFIRPDGMAPHIYESKLLDSLLSHDSDAPGAFVSFSLDPKKEASVAKQQYAKDIEKFLEKISDALNASLKDESDYEDIDPAELERYWVFWKHDQNLVDGQHPNPANLHTDNRNALSQLRSVLGLTTNFKNALPNSGLPKLTGSGSTDEGQFILTPDIAKLFSSDSAFTYIFGRKGTGKTRLCKELCLQNLAEPLLVADDFKIGGLESRDLIFTKILSACNDNYEKFWWLLLDSALETESTMGKGLISVLNEKLNSGDIAVDAIRYMENVEKKAQLSSKLRVFLIDGIETAVPAARLREFVESVFRFMAVIQYNKALSTSFTIRLFLRLDLSRGFTQNVEQQVEGHKFTLHWSKTASLNFALARLVSLPWFKENFREVCDSISREMERIAIGALPDEEAEALLLNIFPTSLERNKLKTTTFLATYFSDAGGDEDRNATFYPRLFDGFLRTLAQKCQLEQDTLLISGRLPSKIILEAYDQASKEFIVDVRTELHSFLNIDTDIHKNRDAVDRLVASFNGLRTPFLIDNLIEEVSDRANIPQEKVRQAITDMRAVGMFEQRPGYAGELRTGRLYKSGLGMKYGRARDKEFE